MVRLKEMLFYKFIYFINISIPYGAIKRLNQLIPRIFLLIFQFLMVRLKVFSKF